MLFFQFLVKTFSRLIAQLCTPDENDYRTLTPVLVLWGNQDKRLFSQTTNGEIPARLSAGKMANHF